MSYYNGYNEHEKENKVKFKLKPEYKPPTVVTEEITSTEVNDEKEIYALSSKEEIFNYRDDLMKQLEELEKMKKDGYDREALREQYKRIEHKYEMLNKFEIIETKKDQGESTRFEKFTGSNSNDFSASNLKIREEKDFQKKSTKIINALHTSPQPLFEYFLDLSTTFDILLVTCSYDINLKLSFNKIEKILQNNPKIKIAFLLYHSKNKYEISEFLTNKDFNTLKFNIIESKDLRNVFINMKWRKDNTSLRIVCKIVNYDYYLKEEKKDDAVESLIKYNKILNYLFIIKRGYHGYLNSEKSIVCCHFNCFENDNFNNMLKAKSSEMIAANLYDLKRMKVKDQGELFNNLKPIIKSNEILSKEFVVKTYNLIKIVNLTNMLESLDKNDMIPNQIQCRLNFKRKENVTLSSTVFEGTLLGPDSRKTYNIWIEIPTNSQILFTLIHIQETTKLFAREFNNYHKSEFIEVPSYYFIESSSISMIYQTLRMNNQEPKIMSKMNHNILQAFMHFTYHFSNQNLLIIDIRSFEKKNGFLITEPIIFCKNEKIFGSSNLGSNAIEYLMAHHICNSLCGEFSINDLNIKHSENSCCILS